jgi:hypothetical protein
MVNPEVLDPSGFLVSLIPHLLPLGVTPLQRDKSRNGFVLLLEDG